MTILFLSLVCVFIPLEREPPYLFFFFLMSKMLLSKFKSFIYFPLCIVNGFCSLPLLREQLAEEEEPAPVPTGGVTLGRQLTLILSFYLHNMGIIVPTTSTPGGSEE